MIRLNLGSIIISKKEWAEAKALGYSRDDIRSIIVQNGQESFNSCLDVQIYCYKCNRPRSEGFYTDCEHDWTVLK